MDSDVAWRVVSLLQDSCRLLDKEDFAEWLAMCADDFSYRLHAYSHELRSEMTWLEHSKDQLRILFDTLPEHQRYPGRFLRHVSVQEITQGESAGEVRVTSTVLISHTDFEGLSRLYAVGRYRDQVSLTGDRPQLLERAVDLDTRVLPFGSHIPL